jgi:hypothetical protein
VQRRFDHPAGDFDLDRLTRGFVLSTAMKTTIRLIPVFLAFVCLIAAAAKILAVSPPPDGGYPGGNTAEGQNDLLRLTTGTFNTAIGFYSVAGLTEQSFDTGVGAGTLVLDTEGTNTAVGAGALLNNTTGFANNAVGAFALLNNVGGFFNNAHGHNCLLSNNSGDQNNAFGDEALFTNTTGSFNSAFGDDTLHDCTSCDSNVAMGDEAGNSITDGSTNVAIGAGAGTNVTSGMGNVYVGANVTGPGDEIRFIRIGDTSFTDYDCFIAGIIGREVDAGTAALVLVDNNHKLGTVPTDAAGHRVSFKPQAMLDESLKQQKRIAELEGTVARLAAMVKEQAAQIQKVNARLEIKLATKVVVNKP